MKTLSLLCLFLFSTNFLFSQTPKLIPFQGVLTDSEGRLLPDAEYTIGLKLFSEPEGGQPLWQVNNQKITLINGMFNYLIGSEEGTPKFSSITLDSLAKPLWLEIIVLGSTLPKRLSINSSFFALVSERAMSSKKSDDGVPIGTIISFFGIEEMIPENWLLCDGRSFDIQKYPILSDMLTKMGLPNDSTPDLRGMFLRGADSTSFGRKNNDPDFSLRSGTGYKIGSIQLDEIVSHSHSFTKPEPAPHRKQNGNDYFVVAQVASKAGSTDPFGGSETRPKNVYVNFIIKAR